ncbi:MAG: transporter [Bacteroidales bacterium]|nr:transporter [Bacteroidales bacterium]
MNKTIIIILILIVSNLTQAQVGGLSASKLAALCVETVPNKSIEFEPAIGFNFSGKAWNKSGSIVSVFPGNDSMIVDSYMGFRLTYGIFKNMEAGLAFPVSMGSVQLGVKYKLPFEYEQLKLGLLAGGNFLTGNRVITKKGNSINNTGSFVTGIIVSYQLTRKLGMDFNLQYQHLTRNVIENHNHDILLNTDIGYFINNDLQFVMGINYIRSDYNVDDFDFYKLTLNPGLTIESAKNFILVVNFPFDTFGKNSTKFMEISLALTIMLN